MVHQFLEQRVDIVQPAADLPLMNTDAETLHFTGRPKNKARRHATRGRCFFLPTWAMLLSE